MSRYFIEAKLVTLSSVLNGDSGGYIHHQQATIVKLFSDGDKRRLHKTGQVSKVALSPTGHRCHALLPPRDSGGYTEPVGFYLSLSLSVAFSWVARKASLSLSAIISKLSHASLSLSLRRLSRHRPIEIRNQRLAAFYCILLYHCREGGRVGTSGSFSSLLPLAIHHGCFG